MIVSDVAEAKRVQEQLLVVRKQLRVTAREVAGVIRQRKSPIGERHTVAGREPMTIFVIPQLDSGPMRGAGLTMLGEVVLPRTISGLIDPEFLGFDLSDFEMISIDRLPLVSCLSLSVGLEQLKKRP